ncbi:MAG: AAA family ATPase [Paludibacteraceae bacterium]|nr:AAA family ATPase [Paludibacteraceae bacterium]
MNALKYLNSRLGKTIEQIKKAYLSDKHICFIVCSEPEFIEGIIGSGAFFPNNKPSQTDSEASVKFVKGDSFIKSSLISDTKKDSQEIKRPQLYVYNSCPYYFNDKITDDIHLPLESLTNYVNHITSLTNCNFNLTIGQKQKLTYLKESMILIIVKSKPQIPTYIAPYSETIVVPFMEENEFKEFVSLYLEETENAQTKINIDGYKSLNNEDYLTKLYHNMRGLNATQIRTILWKNQMQFGRIYQEEIDDKYEVLLGELIRNIRKEFECLIETSRALSLEGTSSDEPAGLSNLTKWLRKYKEQVSSPHEFSEYILEAPKGLLVSGIPGTGKSLMAKYIAGYFKLSLVKLDFGNLGGGLVGESEKNMDNALNLIEAISPCVLWVDEMEKAFSGSNGNSGHETTKRLIGKFLTWMQEKGEKGVSCFVFATANDISQMPPEMFRSGRFDDKFFTFMPTSEECAEIFASIINGQSNKYKKRKSKNLQAKPLFNSKRINETLFMGLINDKEHCLMGFPKSLDDRNVNRLNKFFIGADIDQLIKKAKNLYLLSISNENLDIDDSIKYIKGITSSDDAVFDSNRFIRCLKVALKEIKTYGETNLDDIAKCYAQLAINNFNNASSNFVLPFEGYDELSYIAKKANDDIYLYDLDRINKSKEKSHYNELKYDYDKCLYIIVRNTINQIAKEIVKRRL